MVDPNLKTVGTILTMHDLNNKGVLPFYSSRGLTQTMTPIDAAQSQRRTVNGQLVDLSLSRMHKYASVISARDVRPPSRDDVFPGREVWVGCAYLLSYITSGGSPSRDVVSGSAVSDGHGFTFYRPLILFMLGKPAGSFEEWQAGYQWSIPMQEV